MNVDLDKLAAAVAEREEPLEVELPVCPICKNIGKIAGKKRLDWSCVGGVEDRHKQTKMKRRLFREVVE